MTVAQSDMGTSWFRDEVLADLAGTLDPEGQAALRHDRNISAFYEELQTIARQLHAELEDSRARRERGEIVNSYDRRQTVRQWQQVNVRLAEIKPLAKRYRRSTLDARNSKYYARLRDAIRAHRENIERDTDPSAADRELWAVLDATEAT